MNRQIVEEASEWFVQISEGDADVATRRRFHDWLSRSPEHIEAYLKILPVWEDATKLYTHTNDREALIAWARASANVVPLASLPLTRNSGTAGTGNTGHRQGISWRIGMAHRWQERRE